jgi:ABC-type transporter Mla MlaB component
MLSAFVRAGLAHGQKVVHMCDACEHDDLLARLRADGAVDAALDGGQFEVRDAAGAYTPAGVFDVDGMVRALRDDHGRALAEGYTGLSLCSDVGAGLSEVAAECVVQYEQRAEAELAGGSLVLLCQYHHPAFDERTLSEVMAVHNVVVSPELAAIGRTGLLAAALVTPPDTLRLDGELDFEAADDVARVFEAAFPGPRRVDAADLDFVDVAGMRALRGHDGELLIISAASEAVRRLVALLGWDTDPSVQVAA